MRAVYRHSSATAEPEAGSTSSIPHMKKQPPTLKSHACPTLTGKRMVFVPQRQFWSRSILLLGSVVFVTLFLLSRSYALHQLVRSDLVDQMNQVLRKTGAVQPKRLQLDTTEMRRYQCIGWRMTGECSPSGLRDPENDKNCTEVITQGMSGYCEVKDLDSGEHFQVMRKHCNGLKTDVEFRCSDAPGFANYHVEAADAIPKAIAATSQLPHVISDSQTPRDGIVMVVYPKLLSSAYAVIATLRTVLECSLPIEIWFHVDEIGDDYGLLAPLQQLATSVGGISFHPMRDLQTNGFNTKVFAICNSIFDRVLFLDADNVPVRDPSFLFDSHEFNSTGAVFWPDFWQPTRSLFNVVDTSMLWELIDMPFIDMFEQESGQLLIDRPRHREALELVKFYAFHEPNYFEKLELVYGDKDFFRLAWLKLNSSFYMIQSPPALAGRAINGSFCGMTMAQHDAGGRLLFLHRNQLKLTGERNGEMETAAKENTVVPISEALGAPQADGFPDPAIWTHLLSFNSSIHTASYAIDAYRAPPQFPHWQPCYGRRNVDDLGPFYIDEFANIQFSGVETDVRRSAMEAAQLDRVCRESWVQSADA